MLKFALKRLAFLPLVMFGVTALLFACLQFLTPEMGSEPDVLERFRREARACSALNHPNICTVFDLALERAAQADVRHRQAQQRRGDHDRHRDSGPGVQTGDGCGHVRQPVRQSNRYTVRTRTAHTRIIDFSTGYKETAPGRAPLLQQCGSRIQFPEPAWGN